MHSDPLALASVLDGMMSTPQHQLLQCLFEGVRLWPITWVAQEGTLEGAGIGAAPAAGEALKGGNLGDNPLVER